MVTGNYTISDYLLDRLAELGVGSVFGVPGDYTLSLLDHVVAHPSLEWVGCANELNAGYAADGYGRMRGAAALMTTFGVGELSAINAVAGSFAEHVAVVHIVGAPSSGTQAAGRIVHHSLGDGIFTQFLEMHDKITCARAAISPETACSEIDRVLTAVRSHHLPGYLLLPADVGEQPAEPAGRPLSPPRTVTDPNALGAFATAAAKLLADAETLEGVRVLGGLLTHRLGATGRLAELVSAGSLAYATSLWGKSLLDESNPNYLGIYAGSASDEDVRTTIEQADVLIVAGVQFTDLNSGFFTQELPRERTIELGASTASVGWTRFEPVSLPDALHQLTELVAGRSHAANPPIRRRSVTTSGSSVPPLEGTAPLTQETLWRLVPEHLRPGDIVLADQGTSFYGAGGHRLPSGVTFLGQPLWASIGYSLPAMLGAGLAEPTRRTVLLIGDGAGQMTVQELSTIARHRLNAVVVVVDNDGYTVERAIHGPDQPYNDIAHWDWTKLPAAFSATTPVAAFRATTPAEFDAAWSGSGPGLTVIQAVVPKMDVPELLQAIAHSASKANAQSAD